MIVVATMFGMVALGIVGAILDRWWRKFIDPRRDTDRNVAP